MKKKGLYRSKAFGNIPVFITGYQGEGISFTGRNLVMDKILDVIILFDVHVMHMEEFVTLEESDD